MSIAIIWMGCINACCAIVRERAVFDRDRMFDLDIRSYIVAKITVLAVMGIAQVIVFLAVQGQLMRLPGNLALHATSCAVMALSVVTASSLGLLISAVARTSYAAVVTVPIVMMPQIIFSEVVLGQNIDDRIPSLIENLTITKWCYEALVTIGSSDIDWEILMKSGFALTSGAVLFLMLAAGKLKLDDW